MQQAQNQLRKHAVAVVVQRKLKKRKLKQQRLLKKFLLRLLKKLNQKKKPLNNNEAVLKIQKARSFFGFAFFVKPLPLKGF